MHNHLEWLEEENKEWYFGYILPLSSQADIAHNKCRHNFAAKVNFVAQMGGWRWL